MARPTPRVLTPEEAAKREAARENTRLKARLLAQAQRQVKRATRERDAAFLQAHESGVYIFESAKDAGVTQQAVRAPLWRLLRERGEEPTEATG
jgi:hypothetical protein